MIITRCRTNHFRDPVGFRLNGITFSWVTQDAEGKSQTSARIRVWKEMRSGDPVFDTGWAGLDPLGTAADMDPEPRTRYVWTVSVRSDAGEEAESGENFFETGKLGEPWEGKWITCNSDEPRHPAFSREFEIDGCRGISSARLYICGLGLYEAFINGRRVGDEHLTPYCNCYRKWIQYQTYDVTQMLAGGSNTIRAELGNGWAKGRFGISSDEEGCFFRKEWDLIAELRIRFSDGTEKVVGTDEDWTVERMKIWFSGIYDGERRDDTLPDLPAEKAVLAQHEFPLTERMSISVKVRETLLPRELIFTPKGEWVYDLGQNMTGTFRMRVHVPAGTEVRIQTGEVLQDGCFYRGNLRSALSEYIYVSDGREHILEPRFTFFGFRYAKVSGVEKPGPDDFTGLVLCSEIEETGRICTGSEKINRLIENIFWGQKGNFLDVPTDCPQRDERLGWTADTHVFVPTACYFSDNAAFYRKYMFDLNMEQEMREGMVPFTVPAFEDMDTSSVWGDAAAIIPWHLYVFYGDRTMLSETFRGMKDWVDFIRRADGGDLRQWGQIFHFGDWLALDSQNADESDCVGGTDVSFIAYVYYYNSARLTQKAARVLGAAEDEKKYGAIAREILDYIRREYYTSTGRCAVTTQTAYVLTLFYSLCGERKRALDSLVRLIELRGGTFVTGFVGTPLLLPALSGEGMDGLAYDLLFNEKYPGWLYEVNLGATTVWERWNSLDSEGRVTSTEMNSLNHYALGSVGEWIWRTAAGINPREDAPGFRKADIRPVPDRRLGYVEAVYDSPSGRDEVSWKYTDSGSVALRVRVPFGCEAELSLPWSREKTVRTLLPGEYSFEVEAE